MLAQFSQTTSNAKEESKEDESFSPQRKSRAIRMLAQFTQTMSNAKEENKEDEFSKTQTGA